MVKISSTPNSTSTSLSLYSFVDVSFQFVNMLDLIEYRMHKGHIGCRKLSGHLSVDKRDEVRCSKDVLLTVNALKCLPNLYGLEPVLIFFQGVKKLRTT